MAGKLGDYRPQRLEDLIGFSEIRRGMMQAVDAVDAAISLAKVQDSRDGSVSQYYCPGLPHYLVCGVRGMGKSTLARLYGEYLVRRARERNWSAIPVSMRTRTSCVRDEWTSSTLPEFDCDYYRMVEYRCTKRTSIIDLDRIFFFAAAYGLIILDEIQTLSSTAMGWLLPVLNSGSWESPTVQAGRKAALQAGIISQEQMHSRFERPSFQVIAMTTDEGKLDSALFDRMVALRLMEYTPEEMRGVVGTMVSSTDMKLSERAVDVIVDRSRRHPRTAAKLIQQVYIEWMTSGRPNPIESDCVLRACNTAQIGPGGLSLTDVITLRTLSNSEHPIGGETLARMCRLGNKANLEQDQEWMVARGYIHIVSGGRIITDAGRHLLSDYDAMMLDEGR
jgi:Holliday junction resolvasome RuvABC ATP-dependent DNA helicase subunit